MLKIGKNIMLVILLAVSFSIIYALPPELSKCSTSTDSICGDSYGPNNVYMGKKCWPEGGSKCVESSNY